MDCFLLHGWGFRNTVFTTLKDLLPKHWNIMTPCLYQMATEAGNGSFGVLTGKLLDEIKRDTILIGWSMGGLVAQLAAARSQRITQLVLIASAPRLVNANDWHHTIDPQAYNELVHDFDLDPERALARFLGLVAQGEQHRKQVLSLLKQYRAQPEHARVLSNWLREIQHSDLRQTCSDLTIPLLMLFGEQDALISNKVAGEMENVQARQTTFKRCGHAPFISRAEAVAEALSKFCNSNG